MDLKTYLQSRRISNKEFAELIDVAPCSVSNYICKKRKPALEIAIRIEKATNGKVTVEELFTWWKEKNHENKVNIRRQAED